MIKKSCFGIIVGHRSCFSSQLARAGRQAIIQQLEKLNLDYIIIPENATATGCIETYSDARICGDLFRKNSDRITGIIVTLPNFGDELGVVNSIVHSGLQVPILLHAASDDINRLSLSERRDAFCGKISVANSFYQYNIPFTNTTNHTSAVDSEEFAADIVRFDRICRLTGGLKSARIGQLGTRPMGFQTVRASEKLLQASGITVVPVGLTEIFAAAAAIDSSCSLVRDKISQLKSYGRVSADIAESNIIKQVKFTIAVEEWVKENQIDAVAIQCWDAMQKHYGCAACTTMSMLGEQLIPAACEVDIAGAVSMYVLTLATDNPAAILDWNNNYKSEIDKCVCTHCGNFPASFIGTRPEIANLDVLGTVLGTENCFGAVKGQVKAGPMTFFRISTDDSKGRIKCYLGNAEFTDDPFPMAGGIAVCHVPRLPVFLNRMIKDGFEHHVAMVREHAADIIEEAVTNYLNWDLYRHCGQ